MDIVGTNLCSCNMYCNYSVYMCVCKVVVVVVGEGGRTGG